MGKHPVFSVLLIGAMSLLPGCIQEKVYLGDGNREKTNSNNGNNSSNAEEVEKGFSFDLRKEITLTIQTAGGNTADRQGVPFLIFGENPFNGKTRVKSIRPIGGGYSGENGQLTTHVHPNPEMTQLYVVASNGTFGTVQQVSVESQTLTFTKTSETDPSLLLDEAVSENYYGTLAFEDLWPWGGDYDFNDLVMSYSYSLTKNTDNKIAAIDIVYKALATGTAFNNGFGLQLPVPVSNLRTIKGANTESGCDQITLLLFEGTQELFVYTETGDIPGTGFANVYSGYVFHPQYNATVHLEFKEPVEISIPDFNPFIYINNKRANEVHLTNKPPTEKADLKELNSGNDYSIPSSGVYYKNKKRVYPWALDIPRLREESANWKHLIEAKNLELQFVYPDIVKWIETKGEYKQWYNPNNENVDTSSLFSPKKPVVKE